MKDEKEEDGDEEMQTKEEEVDCENWEVVNSREEGRESRNTQYEC